MTANAAASGTFAIGGDLAVHRLGFGAMRITGKGIWGQPADAKAARVVLQRLPALGVSFIDTADSYGPHVSEELIRETLHPYHGLVIATKGGLTRPGPDDWRPNGKPSYLRQCVEGSLKRLGLERIDLWQLHRIDPRVPRDEQFGAIAEMQKAGLIRHAGLSEVSIEEIRAAEKHFRVATVQNQYNLSNRRSEDVLHYCEQHGIGFIPWFPLGAGALAQKQLALAWCLAKSKVMLPIPGTCNVAHLEQNVGAAAIVLSAAEIAELERSSERV
ncbi:MAG TPA: aldo/keto reductase [Kofleriaceae bacterium]|jgi:aryl-alcohol dehydrogenase-like predicted oxidoreductase